MQDHKKFIFIESNTTGTGELLIRKASAKNLLPILITMNPDKYAFLPLDNIDVVTLDTSSREGLLDYLLRIKNIAGIYSSSESYIEIAAWLAEQLDLPGTNPQSIAQCRDKFSLHQNLYLAGIKSPQTQKVINLRETKIVLETISFPVIVKPNIGTGSIGVRLCKNKAEATDHVQSLLDKNYTGILIQEYIDADEFSVEVCSMYDKHHIIGITKKHLGSLPFFVETGHDFPANLSDEAKHVIKHTISSLLSALNLDFGFFHIELRIKNHSVFIIEVNPRLAGGMLPVLIEKTTDIDLLDLLIDLYTDCNIDIKIIYKKFSSIRHLVPNKSGILEHVHFKDLQFVDEVKIIKKKGDSIIIQGDFRDRIAYVIVSDSDAISCQEKANKALENFHLQIEIEPES